MVWILISLASAALLLSQWPLLAGIGLSALPLAVLIGALYGNSPLATASTAETRAVLGFAQQKLLRLGIILFGFNLSLTQLLAVGWPALVADAIRDVSHRGEIVLDPFCGSGATLLAAEKAGRTARAIELDPLYVDVAIRRWQQLTGEQAVLVTSGETFVDREQALATDEKEQRHDHQ